MPFFSIIIPTYNTEIYLQECLESIKNQTFNDFEVIVINDGSPNKNQFPETIKQIFDKVADHRFTYFEQKNQGVATARNLGLSKANGQWIFFLDSDDYIENTFLEKNLKVIKNGKNPHNQLDTFTHGNPKEIVPLAKFLKFLPVVNNLTNSLVFPSYTITSCTMFEKKYINFEFPLIHGGEDTIFTWKYMLNLPDQNTIFVNSGATMQYRMHDGQYTTSNNAETKQFIQTNKFLKANMHKIKSFKNRVLAKLFIARFDLYTQRLETNSPLLKSFITIFVKFLTLISLAVSGCKKA